MTHPVSIGYSIDPNSSTPFTSPDIPIINNSASPVRVSVSGLKATSGIGDVAPTSYLDWNRLTAAQTESGIALGANGASGNLAFTPKFGLAWANAKTVSHELTLDFDIGY